MFADTLLGREKGKSYRINYAKDLPSIDGQLTLTDARYCRQNL
ncbi:hypothetical protein [Providencia hangzhouensis]